MEPYEQSKQKRLSCKNGEEFPIRALLHGNNNAFPPGNFENWTASIHLPLLLPAGNRLNTIVGCSSCQPEFFHELQFTRSIEFQCNYNKVDITIFIGVATCLYMRTKQNSPMGMNSERQ
jgi:hypothetical protein